MSIARHAGVVAIPSTGYPRVAISIARHLGVAISITGYPRVAMTKMQIVIGTGAANCVVVCVGICVGFGVGISVGFGVGICVGVPV